VDFIEKSFGKEVKEIKLSKLKTAFQIWSAMMRNGKAHVNDFSCLIAGSSTPINPFLELLKSFTFTQKNHTLPAIGLSITEQLPMKNPSHYIELGKKLKQEITEILGKKTLF
jgi:hypothetical protein